MKEATGSELELLQAQLIAQAEKVMQALAVSTNQGNDAGLGTELFDSFLRHYFDASVLQEFQGHEPAQLCAMACGHWLLAGGRARGEARVRVYSPEQAIHGWSSPHVVIEVVADDMPFLVDSVSMSVRDAGGVINTLLHPVVQVRRDANGVAREVMAPSTQSEGGQAESYIQIQCMGLVQNPDELEQTIQAVLQDVLVVVKDYDAMQQRVEDTVALMDERPAGCDPSDFDEAQAFMTWLKAHNFTFLGYREHKVNEDDTFSPVEGTGLGLLRDDLPSKDPEGFVAPAAELDKYAQSARLLVVTKGNRRSWIHHPEYMDVVTVKALDADRRVVGTHRFVGLFSSDAYATSPSLIPVLRQKVSDVTARARLRPGSHAAKNLHEILEGFPRDELFQSAEDELFKAATGILNLRESTRLRLFQRRDRYGRFYSSLVYMARDRFSKESREHIGERLMQLLNGDEVESQVEFLRNGMVRIHYMVRTPPGTRVALSDDEIQARLLEATRSWSEQLVEVLSKTQPELPAELHSLIRSCPVSYRERVSALEAAADLEYLQRLCAENSLLLRLIIDDASRESGRMRLKLYVYQQAVTLSEVLPTLENFGLTVMGQHPYLVNQPDQVDLWIQEFTVTHPAARSMAAEELRQLFEDAFPRSWHGEVENDGFNRLVLSAAVGWREAVLLRALCKYLLQTGLPFSQTYMEDILAQYAPITRRLVQLFTVRFDPETDDKSRQRSQLELSQALDSELDAVESLDADRVLRGFLNIIRACLRTNYFQPTDSGGIKRYISLKLDPSGIPDLPQPRPMFETFVYAPEVEGVHLRGGKVARGGLRWSDRREDFRTEVLGLMKAQMVKNAVIVPVGAKGGFVVKRGPAPADRQAWLENGIECYKTFIRGLLDITDNLKGGECLPPKSVVRYDEDDPYLVVAADKGTATFSDIANSVSENYGHWLGDAFASGGSAGYDHKKMGITARGAWESVKRHFRELGVDCQNEDFTVVGIGDMGGDVFGNGMLLSKHIRLVAAFNHLHIFIDPEPDAKSSYKERKRLFKAVAGWDSYDPKLISKGGGVYSRKDKSIKLSKQARKALGIEQETLSPNELLHEILKAPVDLLWNGGIGTYVKASSESHLDVGDRANDVLRVNGKALRCKMIGEGGNLGFTQLGRIEFALNGGRSNTDAIDNSAGVDSSDREVNIKIPLNELMLENRLARDDRNRLLEEMTDSVAELVLDSNYAQTEAISLLQRDSVARLDEHANLMRQLERDALLNRAIEYLPDEETLVERRNAGLGLTRPEIAVLFSYAKISLYDALLDSSLPDDPYLEAVLLDNFPPRLLEQHREDLCNHRLRREIIATVLTNSVINRMGMAFVHRLSGEVGESLDKVVKAYVATCRVFDIKSRWAAVRALDNEVPTEVQYALLGRIKQLLKHNIGWMLANLQGDESLDSIMDQYAQGVEAFERALPDILVGHYRSEWDRIHDKTLANGAPEDQAVSTANALFLSSALDVVGLAERSGLPMEMVANSYFQIGENLSVPWLLDSIIGLKVDGRWQALARGNLRDDAYRLHRNVVAHVLEHGEKDDDVETRIKAWSKAHSDVVRFSRRRIAELQSSGVSDFLSLAVAVRELRKLSRLRPR